MDPELEKRLAKLEKVFSEDDWLTRLERKTVRITTFVLLELGLLTLLTLSLLHFVHLIRALPR